MVTGWALVAPSIVLLLRARLGVAPYDVLNAGISNRLGVAQGTASWIGCAALVVVALLLGVRPGLGTAPGALVVGAVINWCLAVTGDVNGLALRWSVFTAALAPLYLGVCCLILSRTGSGPTELVTRGLIKTGSSVRVARWVVEGGCLALGALLGGTTGPGTVVLLVVSGPVIAFLLPRVARFASVEFRTDAP
jgi:uncharacterized membrane protein YczE